MKLSSVINLNPSEEFDRDETHAFIKISYFEYIEGFLMINCMCLSSILG
jgi:hypothetical protein